MYAHTHCTACTTRGHVPPPARPPVRRRAHYHNRTESSFVVPDTTGPRCRRSERDSAHSRHLQTLRGRDVKVVVPLPFDSVCRRVRLCRYLGSHLGAFMAGLGGRLNSSLGCVGPLTWTGLGQSESGGGCPEVPPVTCIRARPAAAAWSGPTDAGLRQFTERRGGCGLSPPDAAAL